MARSQVHQSYGPGKFEGESCIARFAYNVTLNGFGEWGDCNCDANNGEVHEEWECTPECPSQTQRINGPFTIQDVEQFEKDTQDEMCQECTNELLTLDHVDTYEDS